MFNLFKKNKKEEPERELLNWEKPKTFEATYKIDLFVYNKKIKLIKEISKKVGIENIDSEILDGVNSWIGPDTKTGYNLLIYIGTSIIDKLTSIEKLLKSNAGNNTNYNIKF